MSAFETVQSVPTAQLIAAMLQQREGVSDLIFSPGRPPQVEAKGELIPLPFQGFELLTPQQTLRDRRGPDRRQRRSPRRSSRRAGRRTCRTRSPGVARFRVNIFRQRVDAARSSCASFR